MTSDMLSDMMAPSMEMTAPGADLMGSELEIIVNDDGTVTVNGANVVMADIIASNGVIHVIDQVLLPPDVAAMMAGNAVQDDMMATEEAMMDEMTMTEEPMMATEEAMMDDGMMTGSTVFASLNPADAANDAVVRLSGDLGTSEAVFGGFADIANVQSVAFTSDGTAYVTVDVTADSGAIVVVDMLADAEPLTVGMGSRMIGGLANAGLAAPKGIDIAEELDLVLVANNGSGNIKGFSLSAEGDVAPTVFIDNFGDFGGNVWDVHYDATTDTLFAAGTTGALFLFNNFSTDMGVNGPTSTIIPSDASGAQISVNLHGVAYDAASDTVILTDVGSADSNSDGQIFTITGASMATGNVPVTARISGAETMLGNPVDLVLDGGSIIVAEKANDMILRYDDILGLTGDVTAAADTAAALTKPESVALYGAMDMGMTDDGMMATEEAMMEDAGTIVDIAVANGNFTTLVAAVQAAGLVDVLADPNAQWTVFAPTDEAFAALPEGTVDMLLQDIPLLTRILTYHVVEGAVTSDMLSDMMAPSMEMTAPGADLMGSELEIIVNEDGTVTVNGANVVMADIIASNGVIHVIDQVLLPPDVAAMMAGS